MKHKLFCTGGKIVVTTLFTAALIGSQAGTAFALGNMTSYTAPTSISTIDSSVLKIGTKNTGTYGEILGLNTVTKFGVESQTLESAQSDVLLGVFGTDVNTNPNPYLANAFYNIYAKANPNLKLDLAGHYSSAGNPGIKKPDSADTTLVAEYGNVSALMSYRPDVILGCDPNSHSNGNAIILKSDGKTAVGLAKASEATSGYTDQVNTINSFSKDSEYYQTGDESYDPYYVELAMFYGDAQLNGEENITCDAYSTYTAPLTMYRIATAAEAIKYTDSSKTTRYGDALEIAEEYEEYLRGIQDYVLMKLDYKTITKKKVALISEGSIDTEAKTATVYKGMQEGSVKTYNGSGNGSSIPISDELLSATTTNIAGNYNVSDESWTASVSPSQLMKADCIFLESSSDEQALKTLLADAGYAEKDFPSIFVTNASNAESSWGPDRAQSVATYLGFVYPEVINPVHTLAYYYTHFYHVKSDETTLSNVLGYDITSMSLPEGVDASLDGYSDKKIQSIIDEGMDYYNSNKTTIDSTYPVLKTTSYVTLDQSIKLSPATKSYKVAKTKKAAQKFTVKVSGAKGSVSAKAANTKSKKALSVKVNSKKKLTVKVKKGTKKGTYKINVKAGKSGLYKAATKTLTVKVK